MTASDREEVARCALVAAYCLAALTALYLTGAPDGVLVAAAVVAGAWVALVAAGRR